jgi:hypothetical protein
VLASGVVDGAWPADGRAVCAATNNQYSPTIVSDGTGGAIVTWYDSRNGTTYDIYAQHVLASGAVDGAWPVDGRALCTAAGNRFFPVIVSDGAGGAIVTWQDLRSGTYDIYAQHVLASGAVDGAWPADGRALCTAPSNQASPAIVSDGAGGAIVTWYDFRGGAFSDIYAQHVLASGAVDGAWPADGRALSTVGSDQQSPAIISDGSGGAVVAWQDRRNSTNYDIYAQRVGLSGYLGTPEPVLVSVRDVPNDNGGRVKVSWLSTYLDTEVPYVVDHYWVFRSAPPSLAVAALASGARLMRPGDSAPLPGERAFFTSIANATAYYWEYVASVSATHFSGAYSYTASTTSDSVAAGNPKTAFIVVAYDAANSVFFASNPDSGYSVDNLPPFAPSAFAGTYSGGEARLHWSPGSEPDLDHYQLYRGSTAEFIPDASSLIASPHDAEFTDLAPDGSFYKLSAVDSHGNESEFASLVLGTTGVAGGGLPAELSFGRPAPNPASQTATVHLALPRAARVSLAVHDVAGRTVRALVSEVLPAGERDLAWDLRDERGGRIADGIYFMTLEVEGRTLTRRIALLN